MAMSPDPVGRELELMLARDAYERQLMADVEALLSAGFRDAATTLVTKYSTLTQAQRARFYQLIDDFISITDHTYGRVDTALQSQLAQYAELEGAQTVKHLNWLVSAGGASAPTINAGITPTLAKAIAQFPIEGLPASEWVSKMSADAALALRQQVQLGLLNAEPVSQIVRRLVQTDLDTTATQTVMINRMRTLVRTSVTTVHNQASLEVYKANPDVSTKYRYVAVRDARTSAICRALDGTVYAYSDPEKKMPPQHPNCRSTIVPVVDYTVLGKPGQTSNTTFSFGSYAAWLTEQSDAEQDRILGKLGGKLFRQGTPLAELVANDGRQLTIAQLKVKFGV